MDNINVRINAGLDHLLLRRLREVIEPRGVISLSTLEVFLNNDAATIRRHLDYWMNAGYVECLFPECHASVEDFDAGTIPLFYKWSRSDHDGDEDMECAPPVRQSVWRDCSKESRLRRWWPWGRPNTCLCLEHPAPC